MCLCISMLRLEYLCADYVHSQWWSVVARSVCSKLYGLVISVLQHTKCRSLFYDYYWKIFAIHSICNTNKKFTNTHLSQSTHTYTQLFLYFLVQFEEDNSIH